VPFYVLSTAFSMPGFKIAIPGIPGIAFLPSGTIGIGFRDYAFFTMPMLLRICLFMSSTGFSIRVFIPYAYKIR